MEVIAWDPAPLARLRIARRIPTASVDSSRDGLLLALGMCVLVACGDPSIPPSLPGLGAREIPATVQQDTLRRRLNAEVTAGRQSAIVDAAARVSAAVVSVNVIRRRRQASQGSVFDFFMPREYERLVEGIGSGFIISPNGIVVTNQHVTEGASQIVVTTSDGTDYPAEILGEDPLTDIAVLKIDAARLPTVALGTTRDLKTGEWVVAIGTPGWRAGRPLELPRLAHRQAAE